MISLLVWLILGFVVGVVAKAILPGRDGAGIVLTTVLGIVGAVVGGAIGSLVGYPMVSSFNNIAGSFPSFVSSVIGAIVVLAIFRMLSGRPLRA